MATFLILNGPNLNLLGSREPAHYGSSSLDALVQQLDDFVTHQGHVFSTFQSNAEHELIDRVHVAYQESVDFIVVNPAALTHTSVALRDAFAAVQIPFIEVHLSNIYAREPFRHHSYFSDLALGVISGLGPMGYELALRAGLHYLESRSDA